MLRHLAPLALALSIASSGCSVALGITLGKLAEDPAKPEPGTVPLSTKAFFAGFVLGGVIDVALMLVAADIDSSYE